MGVAAVNGAGQGPFSKKVVVFIPVPGEITFQTCLVTIVGWEEGRDGGLDVEDQVCIVTSPESANYLTMEGPLHS